MQTDNKTVEMLLNELIDINKEGNESIKDKWNIEDEPDNLDFKVQISKRFQSAAA